MRFHAVCPKAVLPGLALLALTPLTPLARAGVLYTNFGPGLSYDVTSGNPVGNALDGNFCAEGSSFAPSVTSPFAALLVALSCATNCPASDPVTIGPNRDNSDQPGAVLESFVVPGGTLGSIGNNNAPLVFNSVLHPLRTSGTRYWITVSSDLNDSVSWNLNTTGDVSDQAISTDGGSTWFSPSGIMPGAFDVNGTVPEPATATGVVGGALLISLLRRRKATSQPS
jgi:hypothetical protein